MNYYVALEVAVCKTTQFLRRRYIENTTKYSSITLATFISKVLLDLYHWYDISRKQCPKCVTDVCQQSNLSVLPVQSQTKHLVTEWFNSLQEKHTLDCSTHWRTHVSMSCLCTWILQKMNLVKKEKSSGYHKRLLLSVSVTKCSFCPQCSSCLVVACRQCNA